MWFLPPSIEPHRQIAKQPAQSGAAQNVGWKMHIEIQTRNEKEGYGLAEIITVQGVRPEWHEAGPSDIPYLACEESTEAFIKSIANGEKPEVDLEYGLSIMEQIEELDRSANEVG